MKTLHMTRVASNLISLLIVTQEIIGRVEIAANAEVCHSNDDTTVYAEIGTEAREVLETTERFIERLEENLKSLMGDEYNGC